VSHIRTIILAIGGGIWIAIGGAAYLSVENKIIGSFLFSLGLFMIVTNELNLFTGKIGYLFDNKPTYIIDLIEIWVGNFIGAAVTALALRMTRSGICADEICEIKLDDSLLSIFMLAVFCGLLMYSAVNGYKTISDPIGKHIAVIVPVMVFILCGFEHCVANMFYFSLAGVWNIDSFAYLGVMTLGNAAGALIMPLILRMKNYDIQNNKTKRV